MNSSSCGLVNAPISVPTDSPFANIINVGIDLIPYSTAVSLLASMSILQTVISFLNSSAAASTSGASCLHGPHHSAQKSLELVYPN